MDLLRSLLGVSEDEPYDKNRFLNSGPTPEGRRRQEVSVQRTPRENVYGDSNAARPAAAPPQPVETLGCWLPASFPTLPSGGRRQVLETSPPLAARTATAVPPAPLPTGSSAPYNDEIFLTPFDSARPVVVSGQLINTMTGEVSETYENEIPPPDRSGGGRAEGTKTATA